MGSTVISEVKGEHFDLSGVVLQAVVDDGFGGEVMKAMKIDGVLATEHITLAQASLWSKRRCTAHILDVGVYHLSCQPTDVLRRGCTSRLLALPS